MKLRTVKKWYYTLFLAAVIVVVVGYTSMPLPLYMAAGLGLLLAMMILLQTFWRCPLCGQPLGRMQVGSVVECPHCKKKSQV